ncbi:DnaJ heat shock N-terminal domain-containing protein putative isoform 1 [Tripterygium wilfordii]|uniref:DnaJ heat shock N-terminal domain-containing protein putative isoform 1 n=1 Tax=Tripterygium wilfordii TaxID=458696 RepID=A0A7J7BXV8_TRIWF|nr:uncharacterized protein LOC119991923 [Tripterygium wilfordii]KAF5726658.1 DnaJ heat shock N-terminal domain-containing protein putative isoform 1 [Tripterygium wilfordii]
MECNKGEATRAKEIAEKKFLSKDIVGARKFALKAQNLYPELEGVSQMIETFDVYNHAENKINGEADWYGILGVNPQADDETVRKHYRKLALMLHPDKNKSIGAEGAFKFISEAWSLLSDKGKRAVYDQKRKGRGFHKVSTPGGGSSASRGTNGFNNLTKSTASNARANKSSSRASQYSTPTSSHKSKSNTFWTVCHRCRMQYEYLRVYLKHNLLCPNCHEPFLAVETPPPPANSSKPTTSWTFPQEQPQNLNDKAARNSGRKTASSRNVGTSEFNNADSYNQTNYQGGLYSRTGGAYAAHVANVVQQAYEKVKREREGAQAATKREEAQRKRNASKRTSNVSSSGHNSAKRRRGTESGSYFSDQMGVETGGVGKANLSGSKQDGFETSRANSITKLNSARDMFQFEIPSVLMQKAKTKICKRLHEWNSTTADKIESQWEESTNEKANGRGEQYLVNTDTRDEDKSGQSVDANDGVCQINSLSGTSSVNLETETLQTLSIIVPDPDFHDFDKDRTERSFGGGQVWAVYDDDDGMPRYYAMIHNVISFDPFAVRISWLNSKTNSELGSLNWVTSGFPKTCGDFRVGRHRIYKSLNSFSHKIRWTKGPCGAIQIYPRKGDVWALYRNWTPDWNELTADEVIHKYDMVEVLEDFDEDQGVIVTPIVKVAGFKTTFHRHLDIKEIRRIPREEMFQFSHLVPSYLLTGQEGPNGPKGCLELDPAATPSDLLQVITDVQEEEIVENGERNEVKTVVNNETWVENRIDNGQKNEEEALGNNETCIENS